MPFLNDAIYSPSICSVKLWLEENLDLLLLLLLQCEILINIVKIIQKEVLKQEYFTASHFDL